MSGFRRFHSGFVIADRDGVIIAGPPQLVSQKLPQSDLTVYNALKDGMAREYSTDKQNYDLTPIDNKDEQNDPQLEKVFIKMPTLGWGLIFESPYRIQKSFILRARDPVSRAGVFVYCADCFAGPVVFTRDQPELSSAHQGD